MGIDRSTPIETIMFCLGRMLKLAPAGLVAGLELERRLWVWRGSVTLAHVTPTLTSSTTWSNFIAFNLGSFAIYAAFPRPAIHFGLGLKRWR
jgi:hypothetical protein